MRPELLTLSEAVRTNRLADFVAQEEARGVGSIDHAELDRYIAALISPAIKRSNIAFPITRWFDRKANSSR